jgi:cytosine/adenosine deaminase-related metal-dependent hydrolase
MADRILIEARNRTLAVEGDLIAEPHGRYDLVLRFPHGEVLPGLINAHDHLHRNHYGRLGSPPYADAHAWGRDVERRHRQAIAAGRALPRRQALLAGAWKNLFAGVTTVLHHDPWEPDFDDRFPLRVLRIACADSLGKTPELDGIEPGRPFCLHLAEGCGPASAEEVRRLHDRGLLGPYLIAVHGVGMDNHAVDLF